MQQILNRGEFMLERFEKKVNKIKENLGYKKLGVISFCVFGTVLLLCLQMANVYGRERQKNSDSYNRTLYNIIGYMKNAEVYVEKARITSTKKLQITTFTEVLSQTGLAKEALSTLPVDQNSMGNISKFLTQTSNFSKYAIKKLTYDDLNEQDYIILEKINEHLITITDTLDNIYDEVAKGSIDWNDVEEIAEKELADEPNVVVDGLTDIKNNFMEYEGLIYDGAFSSHLESSTPKLVQGESVVTATEAKEKAIECINNKWQKEDERIEIYSIEYTGKMEGRLSLHTFDVLLNGVPDKITIQITEKGGLLYLMVQDRVVKEAKITEDEAKEIGLKYLNNIGVESVEATYTISQDNMITINYASVQDGVIIYTDLLKVKIAQDTGEVCSVECAGYIFNHHIRDDMNASITETDAASVLNETIVKQDVRLAIIPSDTNEEILTYEFHGKVENREFLIYVNAKTREEEQVLLILNTEGGKLTM